VSSALIPGYNRAAEGWIYLKTPQSDLRQPLPDLDFRLNRAIGKRLTSVDQLIRQHR